MVPTPCILSLDTTIWNVFFLYFSVWEITFLFGTDRRIEISAGEVSGLWNLILIFASLWPQNCGNCGRGFNILKREMWISNYSNLIFSVKFEFVIQISGNATPTLVPEARLKNCWNTLKNSCNSARYDLAQLRRQIWICLEKLSLFCWVRLESFPKIVCPKKTW